MLTDGAAEARPLGAIPYALGRGQLENLLLSIPLLASLPTAMSARLRLMVEIKGDLRRILTLAAGKGGEGEISWLATINDLRTSVENNPLPVEALRELVSA